MTSGNFMRGVFDDGDRSALHRREFMAAAACREASYSDETTTPDWFAHPFSTTGQRAIRICVERCPVREQCLRFALETGQMHGVWGGVDGVTLAWLQRTIDCGITAEELARGLIESDALRRTRDDTAGPATDDAA